MIRAEGGVRLKIAAALAAVLALASALPASAQWRGEGRGGRGAAYQDRGPRGGGGWGSGGWGGGHPAYAGRPAYGPRPAYGGRGFGDGGYGRGGYEAGPRGPPAGALGGAPGGAARAWRRGETLPDGYRGATVPDPGRYHLRRPPNGYDWVGDNRNAYLMQRSTGMVLDSVPGAYEPPPPYRGRRR